VLPGKHNDSKRKARPSFPDQPGKRANSGTLPEPRSDTDTTGIQDREPQPNVETTTKGGSSD